MAHYSISIEAEKYLGIRRTIHAAAVLSQPVSGIQSLFYSDAARDIAPAALLNRLGCGCLGPGLHID